MKSALKLTLVNLVFFINLSSCTKDNAVPTTTPTYPIEGLWIGTYNSDQVPSQGDLYYSFIVKPDGSILTEGLGGDGNMYYARGTWTLTSDTVFAATIVTFVTPGPYPVTQSIKASFSKEGKLNNGTWEDTNNPNGPAKNGKFPIMARIN